MSADSQTNQFYDDNAAAYADMSDADNHSDPMLIAFMAELPAGGQVLDLGCGPGASAGRMAADGFTVDAWDASAEMVARAAARPGVNAKQAEFSALDVTDAYDGIWAGFSLLHAPRADFPGHLAAIHRALCPGGLFHISLKTGDGDARDKVGRFYTYYTRETLLAHLEETGFTPLAEATGTAKGCDGELAHWIAVRARA